MKTDEILDAISKIEDYGELMRIAKVLQNRSNYLVQLAMQRAKQKFKMGDRVRIKDEKGEYHSGVFYGFTKKKVRFYIHNQEIKASPIDFERLEAEVVDRPVPQKTREMTPEEVKKRNDVVDKMLRRKTND